MSNRKRENRKSILGRADAYAESQRAEASAALSDPDAQVRDPNVEQDNFLSTFDLPSPDGYPGKFAPSASELEKKLEEHQEQIQVKEAAIEQLKNKLEEVKSLGETADQFKISPIGVEINQEASIEDVKRFIERVFAVESATHWMYGDALAFGENRKWGEIYEWAVEITGKSKQTLENYAWVSRTFSEISERSEKLKYKHYELLAGVKDKRKRMRLMIETEQNRWSTRRLQSEIDGKLLPTQLDKTQLQFEKRRDALQKLVERSNVSKQELQTLLYSEIEFLRQLMEKLEESI